MIAQNGSSLHFVNLLLLLLVLRLLLLRHAFALGTLRLLLHLERTFTQPVPHGRWLRILTFSATGSGWGRCARNRYCNGPGCRRRVPWAHWLK